MLTHPRQRADQGYACAPGVGGALPSLTGESGAMPSRNAWWAVLPHMSLSLGRHEPRRDPISESVMSWMPEARVEPAALPFGLK